MPATEERVTVGQGFQVAVVIVELSASAGDTNDGGQRCLLAGIGHRFCEARREYIYVTVVGCPDHLVILGFHTSGGIADLIRFDKFLAGHGCIVEDGYPAFVRILCPLQFVFLVSAAVGTARFFLHQVFVTRQYPFAVLVFCAVLAQTHRNGGCVNLVVMFQHTGQGYVFTGAQEVFRQISFVLRIVGGECFGCRVQVRKQEYFRGVTVFVVPFRRTVTGRRGHDIFVVDAIGGKTLYTELGRTLLQFAAGIHDIRAGSAGFSLVVCQGVEILFLEEYPVGCTVVHNAVVDGRNGTFVQRFGVDQHIGCISGSRYRGCDYVFRVVVIVTAIIAAGRWVVVTRCQCQSGHCSSEKAC